MKKIISTAFFILIIFSSYILSHAENNDYILSQGFTLPTFPPTGWSLVYTGTDYWSRNNVSALCLGQGSAKFDFWTAPAHTSQSLITPQFTPVNSDAYLIFSFAYCTYDTTYVDTLRIFGSTNNGSTWSEIITLLGGVNGQLVTAPPQGSPFTPTCQQWGDITLNLSTAGINKIRFNAISAFGNNLYIDSIGVYVITGIKNGSTDLPTSFSLSQNYPNPFNPTTNINYQLPVECIVKLTVSDVVGREIAVLVNEKQNPGIYRVQFDGTKYSSGIYFYKLSAVGGNKNYSDTKKLILLK